jgi:hypothetical protein
MTDNRHFNPKVSKVDPKDDISPKFKVIARDVQKWASCRVGTATTEVRCFCEVFEGVEV